MVQFTVFTFVGWWSSQLFQAQVTFHLCTSNVFHCFDCDKSVVMVGLSGTQLFQALCSQWLICHPEALLLLPLNLLCQTTLVVNNLQEWVTHYHHITDFFLFFPSFLLLWPLPTLHCWLLMPPSFARCASDRRPYLLQQQCVSSARCRRRRRWVEAARQAAGAPWWRYQGCHISFQEKSTNLKYIGLCRKLA